MKFIQNVIRNQNIEITVIKLEFRTIIKLQNNSFDHEICIFRFSQLIHNVHNQTSTS